MHLEVNPGDPNAAEQCAILYSNILFNFLVVITSRSERLTDYIVGSSAAGHSEVKEAPPPSSSNP